MRGSLNLHDTYKPLTITALAREKNSVKLRASCFIIAIYPAKVETPPVIGAIRHAAQHITTRNLKSQLVVLNLKGPPNGKSTLFTGYAEKLMNSVESALARVLKIPLNVGQPLKN